MTPPTTPPIIAPVSDDEELPDDETWFAAEGSAVVPGSVVVLVLVTLVTLELVGLVTLELVVVGELVLVVVMSLVLVVVVSLELVVLLPLVLVVLAGLESAEPVVDGDWVVNVELGPVGKGQPWVAQLLDMMERRKTRAASRAPEHTLRVWRGRAGG